ncbi:hypothetical protein JQS43_08565 [Natronosporangium hydrolyticum]|uniref:Uncharacterized protein n=1 Tax=Natronosporangium hydrolyticum TaxID=2811111 RepID=A0A895YNP2_9ACTN|nr:hypothetical protein [Natronosporangium hydrolyticum]QSB16326.1 hypothetical protein JQS43_08565 [Natronosporangium hydrolyticum]
MPAQPVGTGVEINTGGFDGALEDILIDGSGREQRAIVVMWRPESGPPIFSRVEQELLRYESVTFSFHTDEGPLAVLMYHHGIAITPEREFRDVEVPAEATLLAAEPHVIVVALPEHEIEISYLRDGERERVTVAAP